MDPHGINGAAFLSTDEEDQMMQIAFDLNDNPPQPSYGQRTYGMVPPRSTTPAPGDQQGVCSRRPEQQQGQEIQPGISYTSNQVPSNQKQVRARGPLRPQPPRKAAQKNPLDAMKEMSQRQQSAVPPPPPTPHHPHSVPQPPPTPHHQPSVPQPPPPAPTKPFEPPNPPAVSPPLTSVAPAKPPSPPVPPPKAVEVAEVTTTNVSKKRKAEEEPCSSKVAKEQEDGDITVTVPVPNLEGYDVCQLMPDLTSTMPKPTGRVIKGYVTRHVDILVDEGKVVTKDFFIGLKWGGKVPVRISDNGLYIKLTPDSGRKIVMHE